MGVVAGSFATRSRARRHRDADEPPGLFRRRTISGTAAAGIDWYQKSKNHVFLCTAFFKKQKQWRRPVDFRSYRVVIALSGIDVARLKPGSILPQGKHGMRCRTHKEAYNPAQKSALLPLVS